MADPKQISVGYKVKVIKKAPVLGKTDTSISDKKKKKKVKKIKTGVSVKVIRTAAEIEREKLGKIEKKLKPDTTTKKKKDYPPPGAITTVEGEVFHKEDVAKQYLPEHIDPDKPMVEGKYYYKGKALTKKEHQHAVGVSLGTEPYKIDPIKQASLMGAATKDMSGLSLTALKTEIAARNFDLKKVSDRVWKITRKGVVEGYAYVTGEGKTIILDSLEKAKALDTMRSLPYIDVEKYKETGEKYYKSVSDGVYQVSDKTFAYLEGFDEKGEALWGEATSLLEAQEKVVTPEEGRTTMFGVDITEPLGEFKDKYSGESWYPEEKAPEPEDAEPGLLEKIGDIIEPYDVALSKYIPTTKDIDKYFGQYYAGGEHVPWGGYTTITRIPDFIEDIKSGDVREFRPVTEEDIKEITSQPGYEDMYDPERVVQWSELGPNIQTVESQFWREGVYKSVQKHPVTVGLTTAAFAAATATLAVTVPYAAAVPIVGRAIPPVLKVAGLGLGALWAGSAGIRVGLEPTASEGAITAGEIVGKEGLPFIVGAGLGMGALKARPDIFKIRVPKESVISTRAPKVEIVEPVKVGESTTVYRQLTRGEFGKGTYVGEELYAFGVVPGQGPYIPHAAVTGADITIIPPKLLSKIPPTIPFTKGISETFVDIKSPAEPTFTDLFTKTPKVEFTSLQTGKGVSVKPLSFDIGAPKFPVETYIPVKQVGKPSVTDIPITQPKGAKPVEMVDFTTIGVKKIDISGVKFDVKQVKMPDFLKMDLKEPKIKIPELEPSYLSPGKKTVGVGAIEQLTYGRLPSATRVSIKKVSTKLSEQYSDVTSELKRTARLIKEGHKVQGEIPQETIFRGFGIGGKPIVGVASGRIQIGMPKVEVLKLKGRDISGYVPGVSKTETSIMARKGIFEELGYKTPEIEISKVKDITKEMSRLEDVMSKWHAEKFTREIKTLPEEGVSTAIKWFKKHKGDIEQVYGTWGVEPQMKPSLKMKPSDIDIQFKSFSETKVTKLVKELYAKEKAVLKDTGWEIRMQETAEHPLLIETKAPGAKDWSHAFDPHFPGEGEKAIEGAFGFRYEQPSIKTEKIETMRLSEHMLRKSGSILTFQEARLAPEAHRLKDVVHLAATHTTLAESAGVSSARTTKFVRKLREYYPDAPWGEVPTEIKIKLPSISSKAPVVVSSPIKSSYIPSEFSLASSAGLSASAFISTSPSTAPSPSISPSLSTFPSISPSPSPFIEISESISKSISKSRSVSPSPSPSPSRSPSRPISPSRSIFALPSIPGSERKRIRKMSKKEREAYYEKIHLIGDPFLMLQNIKRSSNKFKSQQIVENEIQLNTNVKFDFDVIAPKQPVIIQSDVPNDVFNMVGSVKPTKVSSGSKKRSKRKNGIDNMNDAVFGAS